MEAHIEAISKKYDEFYRFIFKKGMFAAKATEKGFWGPTPTNEVLEILNQLSISRYRNFIDLGSGDGKVVLLASLFTKATGIEFDPWLFRVARDIKGKLSHIPHLSKAEFIEQDFMEHNLNGYDAVFCVPDKPMGRGLEKKLLRELSGDLIVYGHHFHPSKLNVKSRITVNEMPITVYNR